jgi:putative tryptophan/tyrosine transport system substrate-binding protein
MQFDRLRRREFITLVGGAVPWPFAARGQQPDKMRRVGILMPWTVDDPVAKARVAAFQQMLQQLGWTEGRNIRIDTRWAAGNADETRAQAAELVALAPDAILAATSPSMVALRQVTRTVPIVFVQVIDPVGAGFVTSLARPGGNATGFSLFEFGISGKWLELLKEIAPGVKRAAILRDPGSPAGIGQFAAIQAVAPSFAVELIPLDLHDTAEIEPAVEAFARPSNGGLIVAASIIAAVRPETIITQVARYRLPAVYSDPTFATRGGLICYGPDRIDTYRRAADYVDRILKGGKPADLPVQAPTKYELAINLKTAKALGLTVPDKLLSLADEVIE